MMVSREKLEKLADFYDQGAHSLDPTDPRAEQALDKFEAEVERLFTSIEGREQMTFRDFKRAVISQCKAFLKKNK